MSQIHVEAERIINARPEDVYRFLADYRDKRPHILTSDYTDYQVAQGGSGAGTVVTYTFHTARGARPYELHVEEPAPGTLRERDARSTLTTTWRVAQSGTSSQSRVSIATEWTGGTGIGGFFERTFAPASLRRTYQRILGRLDEALSGAEAGRAAS